MRTCTGLCLLLARAAGCGMRPYTGPTDMVKRLPQRSARVVPNMQITQTRWLQLCGERETSKCGSRKLAYCIRVWNPAGFGHWTGQLRFVWCSLRAGLVCMSVCS